MVKYGMRALVGYSGIGVPKLLFFIYFFDNSKQTPLCGRLNPGRLPWETLEVTTKPQDLVLLGFYE